MTNDDKNGRKLSVTTRLTRAGRDRSLTGPFVNPPVVHASTVLFDSIDDLLQRRTRYTYGRRGTPTIDALEQAIADLEGSEAALLCPSGLSANTLAILSSVKTGDRVLMTDSVYGPVRHFADTTLKRLGVETTYYDPAIGAGIAALIDDRTTVVYCEAPGSLTFEMQDLPAIAEAAHARNATVIFDNTWATPLYFRALDYGADLSVIAATKYISGHADVMLGTVAGNGTAIKRVRETHGNLGLHVGPDDIYLGLRGLRTLAVRLDRHWRSGVTVAEWLARRPEVAAVLYPALKSDPGHTLWRRDMKGASGLFGVVLKDPDINRAKTFVDSLELFGIGASWGGYESLVILTHPHPARAVTPHQSGPLVRFHIGLDDPADLIADIEQAFAAAAR